MQAQPARTGGWRRFYRVRARTNDLCRRKEYSLFPQEERELIHTYLQVSLSRDGEFVATKWQIYLLYLAILFVHGMLNVRNPPSNQCCVLLSLPLTAATLTRSRSAPKCSPR